VVQVGEDYGEVGQVRAKRGHQRAGRRAILGEDRVDPAPVRPRDVLAVEQGLARVADLVGGEGPFRGQDALDVGGRECRDAAVDDDGAAAVDGAVDVQQAGDVAVPPDPAALEPAVDGGVADQVPQGEDLPAQRPVGEDAAQPCAPHQD